MPSRSSLSPTSTGSIVSWSAAELIVGLGGCDDDVLEQPLQAVPRRRLGRGRELARRQPVARRELGVGAAQAPVGVLHRSEELVLQLLGGAFVEQLVGRPEQAEGDVQAFGRLREHVEDLAAGVARRLGHVRNATLRAPATCPPRSSIARASTSSSIAR